MTKEDLIFIVFIYLVVISVLLLVCLSLLSGFNSKGYVCDTEVCYKCCNNVPCSDTYYDFNNDRCVLTLCESSIFTNKNNCYYKPTN